MGPFFYRYSMNPTNSTKAVIVAISPLGSL